MFRVIQRNEVTEGEHAHMHCSLQICVDTQQISGNISFLPRRQYIRVISLEYIPLQ